MVVEFRRSNGSPQRLHVAPSYKYRRILSKVQRHRSQETDQKWKQSHTGCTHGTRTHVPADRADKCDCEMEPALHPARPFRCRGAPSHTSNCGSCNAWEERRGGGRKDDDVPQLALATSEAEAMRRRRSRRTTEFPDCLPLFLCAHVSAYTLTASRAFG